MLYLVLQWAVGAWLMGVPVGVPAKLGPALERGSPQPLPYKAVTAAEMVTADVERQGGATLTLTLSLALSLRCGASGL